MKIIRTAQYSPKYKGRYDDLLEDEGLEHDDIVEARRIFDEQGEGAVEDWLINVKHLDYSSARACVRALGS